MTRRLSREQGAEPVTPEWPHLRPQDLAKKYAVDAQTVSNWSVRGATRAGRRVFLRRVRVGNVWRIPADAWEEFYRAFNGERPPSASDEHARLEKAIREEHRRVRREVGLPVED